MQMAEYTAASDEEVSPQKLRMVVAASSAGTVFEWYDFFIFGLLASAMAPHFFAGATPTAQFIFALLTFAVGFAVTHFSLSWALRPALRPLVWTPA